MTRLACIATALVLAAAALVPFGCGGSESDEIVVDQDGGQDGVAADTNKPAFDGGGIPDANGTDSSDSGSLADGQVLDGGTNPTDAGPGGNTTALPCGAVSACPINGARCCVYPTSADGGTSISYACIGASTCPDGVDGGQTATVLGCTGSANCAAAQVCCVKTNDDNEGLQSATSVCKASCSNNEAQLCDPAAAAPGCVADAGACSSTSILLWNLPATFGTCGGVAP